MVGNKARELVDHVSVGNLVVEIEESVLKLRVRLAGIGELGECFPTFCYVVFEEQSCEVFLFEVASNRATGKESVELCKVLLKRAGLVVIEDGSSTLSTERHVLGSHIRCGQKVGRER